jgi:hypothetical protein
LIRSANDAFFERLHGVLEDGLGELVPGAIRVVAQAVEVAFDAQLREATEVVSKAQDFVALGFRN